MTDRMPSVADTRDDAGVVSPLEFAVLQAVAKDQEERIKRLESLLLGSDPPPASDSLDVTVSREKGIRLRGRASAVALVVALAAITYAATKWGPPARWQSQPAAEGAGGR
jgi:ferric-dicitrate binding protein FerR (iron transport regulator)